LAALAGHRPAPAAVTEATDLGLAQGKASERSLQPVSAGVCVRPSRTPKELRWLAAIPRDKRQRQQQGEQQGHQGYQGYQGQQQGQRAQCCWCLDTAEEGASDLG
ncbi:hypothetical protein B484DRAFT_407125, partial [Ochromonadaceae sp. CCMP2298]